MFQTVLIANRGEIACRIIRTCRELGIRSVAVFSDADADAMHVAMADEAVRIGPARSADSYLKVDAVIAAARATGADAIHPGYGFLSENPDFADAVAQAGMVFVGPPASAIRAMGLKDAAKKRMERAGVPVVPGYHGDAQDPETLGREAAQIGYPVLLKARAGGGGKGMRVVETPEALPEALRAVRAEAAASFGDDHVLVEKLIANPRHVEIQVFGDSHGNVVHLFERDCSLQRRHQKVIEEAPAPGMPDDVRAAMGAAAVRAAAAIGYEGAGTVEFIADGSAGLRRDGFWFMEMNTRLQVEHPVTEAVTGLDLVALQLRVAAGEVLPVTQSDIALNGHAVEARLYAEDPANDFLPVTGRLARLDLPEGVRIDTGVRAGDVISPHYDPMIAKVIAHGADRRAAFDRLASALEAAQISGTVTNLGFLARLCRHPDVLAGRVETGLIGREIATLGAEDPASGEALAVAALAALGLLDKADDPDPWSSLTGFRLWGTASHTVSLVAAGTEISLRVEGAGNTWTVSLPDDDRIEMHVEPGAVRFGDRRIPVAFDRTRTEVTVFLGPVRAVFGVPDPLVRATDAGAAGDTVTAPMTGIVRTVMIASGDMVEEGAAVVTMEAMKMEHTLRAPRTGRIATVAVTEGAAVDQGAVLIMLEPDET